MKNRILFGTIMILAVTGLFLLDGWMQQQAQSYVQEARRSDPTVRPLIGLPMALLVVGLVLTAFLEITRFCSAVGVMILRVSGMIGATMLATLPFWRQWMSPSVPPPAGISPAGAAPLADVLLLLGLITLLVFGEQMVRCRIDEAIRQISATFLAIAYLGVGAALILYIRIDLGLGVLIVFLVSVKFTDIGAYFTGRAIGKHKMIPWLSPGKSWEGLAGGVLVAAAMGALVTWLLSLTGSALWMAHPLSPLTAAIFAGVVGLAGQFADLCESLLKRNAGLKDSGALVPNFGGVLDILDSPLLSAPVALAMLRMIATF
jgi:phosphatidate cytidylyltransferase